VNLDPKPTCSYNHRKKCNICNRKTDGDIKRKPWMSYFVRRIRRRVGHILFTNEKIVAIKESETLLKPRGHNISEHPLFAKFLQHYLNVLALQRRFWVLM